MRARTEGGGGRERVGRGALTRGKSRDRKGGQNWDQDEIACSRSVLGTWEAMNSGEVEERTWGRSEGKRGKCVGDSGSRGEGS